MKKLLILITLAMLVVSCNQAKDAATGPNADVDEGAIVLARVNNVPITDMVVLKELEKLPPQVRMVFEAEGGMKTLFEEIVKKELLSQESRSRNFEKLPEFQARANDFKERLLIEFLLEEEVEKKAEVTDEEARAFYDENAKNFEVESSGEGGKQMLEFETVKEIIKARLLSQKQQETFDAYMKSLRAKYNVEVDEEALGGAFGARH